MTVALLLFGSVLILLVIADRAVQRLPLSPALIYLGIGWLAGAVLGSPATTALREHAPEIVVGSEIAVLISLFAVGLRLRVPPRLPLWRDALLLAGPAMALNILLASVAAHVLFDWPWPMAFLAGAILAPTDPVLASEVQIRSDVDRDSVRLAITAEGGLNDGTALPGVVLALTLLGLHEPGPPWWWDDLVWPIGGGAVLGIAIGRLLGSALRWRMARADHLARDELLYVAAIALAFGLARATSTSAFVVVFAAGATLLAPFGEAPSAQGAQALSDRLGAFGARIERLVEAASVLCLGFVLHGMPLSAPSLAFGLVLVFAARPLAVLAVVRRGTLTRHQRRLVAWFGIRGIGSLYYLAFAIEQGVDGSVADELMAAVLIAIALSIVLHGVSATPLMAAYQRRRRTLPPAPPTA